jgi:hypothetical protein
MMGRVAKFEGDGASGALVQKRVAIEEVPRKLDGYLLRGAR